MFHSLKLRWRISVALFSFAVSPVGVSLFFAADLVQNRIEIDQRSRLAIVQGLLEQNLEASKRESGKAIQLLAGTADFREGFARGLRSGDFSPLLAHLEDP